MSTDTNLIANDSITAKTVRLVHNEIGFNKVMSIDDALLIASNENMDLLQVSDQDVPAVKLVDLNKYKYEQKQKDKQSKKTQKNSQPQVKEIQLSLTIQDNDFKTKLNKGKKFLEQGKHLRVTLALFGRTRHNVSMQEAALEKVKEFLSMLPAHTVVQGTNSPSDRIMFTVKPV